MLFNLDTWKERKYNFSIHRPEDCRDPYERDFARIVHSASFRRLQGKTQVLGLGDSDFYRTRLTHSMEVAQVGAGIVSFLRHKIKNGKNCSIQGISRPSYWLPSQFLISAIGLGCVHVTFQD